MRFADLLVGIGIRRASTFERYRVVEVYRLHRGPLNFPQDRHHFTQSDVRHSLHVSTGANFCQATSDDICSMCPPAS